MVFRYLLKKIEGGKSILLKIEGGRTLIILKSILSLRHNSGGQNHFEGDKMPPLHKFLGIVTYIKLDLLLVTFSLKSIKHMH